jgi:hypothetical protein
VTLEARPFSGAPRVVRAALAAAAVGLVATAIGCVFDPVGTAASYLTAFSFVMTVAIGLITFVMSVHAMNATWPAVIRRVAEMGLAVMPVLLLLAVPLGFALSQLYPWMHPERVADARMREAVLHKLPIMNAPFVIGRAVGYLGCFALSAWWLRAASLAMERSEGDPAVRARRALAEKARLRKVSSVGLPIIGLAGTFAAFDWLLSLSPDFTSTMYGLYVLAGGFLGALGLVAVMTTLAQRSGYLPFINSSHVYALGRLLFAFLIFWAYCGYFQYLLIWLGNKPVEVRFYLERFRPDDPVTSWFLVGGHFALPWLILLSYEVKRDRRAVTALGAWLLACHYVDIHWLVGPRSGGPPWRWQDLPALLLVGGVCVATALRLQRGRALYAFADPDLEPAMGYESH